MNTVDSPVSFRNSPDLPTASLLKEIVDNDQWDDHAVIVFHDGKYFGLDGTSATPTSISQISVANTQEHQQDQKAYATITKEIKELFETSSDFDKNMASHNNLDASLSHFLETHLHQLTKAALVSFLQDQGYGTSHHTKSLSPSPLVEDLPLATTYQALSPEQQQKLDAGKTVVVQNKTTDPECLKLTIGRLRGLMPTFTAYQLTEAKSNAVVETFLNPLNAISIFPYCDQATEGVMNYPDEQTMILESNYQFKAAVPGISKELVENIPFRTTCRSDENNREEVSFENTQATDNLNKIKGRLQAVPHGDKTLASLDLFVDLKGVLLPRIIPDNTIRVATKLILRSALEIAEESK